MQMDGVPLGTGKEKEEHGASSRDGDLNLFDQTAS